VYFSYDLRLVIAEKAIMFSPVSVCIFVCMLIGLPKKTTHKIFMKFYRMVGHNAGPIGYILSDLDPRPRSLEVKC